MPVPPNDPPPPDDDDPLIPPHGGFENLRSHQTAVLIYDATVIFCDRFIDRRSRTHDQMVQAARSGVRNIEEGSVDSATSKKLEMKLTGTSKGSLVELMKDYRDFLRHRRLPIWDKDSPPALAVRKQALSLSKDQYDPFQIQSATAEVAANTLLCLINQATYLIRRQLERLDRDFREDGGFTERLHARRTAARQQLGAATAPQPQTPPCPSCGYPMRQRVARQGPHAGNPFWGCSTYPACKATRPFTPET